MMVPVWEKEFEIKTYEGDKNGELRLVTLMNIFQDCADDHARNLEVGMQYCLEHGLAWVGSAYHLKINKLPKIHEKIKVRTWPSIRGKLTATREFTVFNENGEALIKASSQWVLLNVKTRRPTALEPLPIFLNHPERAVETDFPKIADLAREDFAKPFFVRFDDIDINGHVNNAVYPLWATESVPDEFRMSHTPSEIEILFKKEGLFGEMVKVSTEMDGLGTVHSIKGGDERELAKVKIEWRKNA